MQRYNIQGSVAISIGHAEEQIIGRPYLVRAGLSHRPRLHELANAGKYGALSRDRGQVNISWGIEGDAFVMSWIESKGPVVSRPERRGSARW